MSSTPLEAERRFSGPIRLESGCESSEKGKNPRGKTIPHDPQERHPGAGTFSDETGAGAVADGGTDRAIEAGRGRADRRAGPRQCGSGVAFSAEGIAGPPHPGKKGGAVGWHGNETGTVALAVVLSVVLRSGCGGGSTAPRGTPPGTYPITVQASSGGATASATLKLTVQ